MLCVSSVSLSWRGLRVIWPLAHWRRRIGQILIRQQRIDDITAVTVSIFSTAMRASD
jgi:hypothetical protein